MNPFRRRKKEHEAVLKRLNDHDLVIADMEIRLKRLEREKGIFKPSPSELVESGVR